MTAAGLRYAAVPGTWARKSAPAAAEWWRPGSAWARFVARAGWVPSRPLDPFLWSTDVDGLPPWLPVGLVLGDAGGHSDWEAGGASLRYYLESSPADVVIAHSHGAQVVAYGAAAGLRIPRLITIGSPVRGDMAEVWARARPQIGRWLHLYSAGDWWQIFGQFGDGVIGRRRSMPLADRNVEVPGVHHADLLRDPARFDLWRSRGWLAWAAGR